MHSYMIKLVQIYDMFTLEIIKYKQQYSPHFLYQHNHVPQVWAEPVTNIQLVVYDRMKRFLWIKLWPIISLDLTKGKFNPGH